MYCSCQLKPPSCVSSYSGLVRLSLIVGHTFSSNSIYSILKGFLRSLVIFYFKAPVKFFSQIFIIDISVWKAHVYTLFIHTTIALFDIHRVCSQLNHSSQDGTW